MAKNRPDEIEKNNVSNRIGKAAEKISTEYLIKQGYTIRETNWRMNHLEVDIIAQKGDMIIFIEVKARNGKHDDPLDAVDAKKIKHLVKAANVYLQSETYDYDCRFDVITLTGTPDEYVLEHIEDAFIPPLQSMR